MPVTPEFQPASAPGTLMQRAIQTRQREESHQIELAKAAIALPVMEANAEARRAEARLKYDSVIRTEEARSNAYRLYNKAADDFDFIGQITDDKARAAASREWLGRYAQLANVRELKGEMDSRTKVATQNIADVIKLNLLKTAEIRSFDDLTAAMTPEEVDQARRVKVGIQGRASGVAKQATKVQLPDGSEATVVFDRATGEVSIPTVGGKPSASTDMKDNPLVGQTPGAKETQVEDAKLQAQLKKDRPKRQAALKQAEVNTERLGEEIEELIKKVTVVTAGPGGTVLNKFPGTTARDLEGNLNAIKAVIGFQALQAMREASPTGGALGQVSDFENKLLQSQLGNLEIGQSPKQLVENLKKVKRRLSENFGIVRSAYDQQYGQEGDEKADDEPPLDLKKMTKEELEARLKKARG